MTVAMTRSFLHRTEAEAAMTDLENRALCVVAQQIDCVTEYPPLPFSTGLLLEEATSVFGWPVEKVMAIAQSLFEAGLITYPRTDATRLAPEAIQRGEAVILQLFGSAALEKAEARFMGASPETMLDPAANGTRLWSRITAWLTPRRVLSPSPGPEETHLEAHEAIRPTEPLNFPETLRPKLEPDMHTLYHLIWARFLASLMKPAQYQVVTVDLEPIP